MTEVHHPEVSGHLPGSRISPGQFGPWLWKPPLIGWLELQNVFKVAGDKGHARFGNTDPHRASPMLLLRATDAPLQTATLWEQGGCLPCESELPVVSCLSYTRTHCPRNDKSINE